METYQLLQQAYGEDAMGRTEVSDWFLRFKEGRTSVQSDPRSGRLSKVMYWRFFILRVSYTTSTLPTGKQLTRNSTWRFLKGHRFEATEDIKRNSTNTLLDIPKEEFAKCSQEWQQRWAKCVAAEGNYVEDN